MVSHVTWNEETSLRSVQPLQASQELGHWEVIAVLFQKRRKVSKFLQIQQLVELVGRLKEKRRETMHHCKHIKPNLCTTDKQKLIPHFCWDMHLLAPCNAEPTPLPWRHLLPPPLLLLHSVRLLTTATVSLHHSWLLPYEKHRNISATNHSSYQYTTDHTHHMCARNWLRKFFNFIACRFNSSVSISLSSHCRLASWRCLLCCRGSHRSPLPCGDRLVQLSDGCLGVNQLEHLSQDPTHLLRICLYTVGVNGIPSKTSKKGFSE